jgi:hypothetical protein
MNAEANATVVLEEATTQLNIVSQCAHCSSGIQTAKTHDGHEMSDAAFIFCDTTCLHDYELTNNVSFD